MRIGDWIQQHYWTEYDPNTGESYAEQNIASPQHLPLTHEKHTIIGGQFTTDPALTKGECLVWIAVRSNTTGKVSTIVGGDFETLDDWCRAMNHAQDDLEGSGFPLPEGVMIAEDSDRAEVYRVNDNHFFSDGAFLTVNDFEVVTPKLYSNVYLEDRAYGGPEEGGWWYDTLTAQPEYCAYLGTEAEAEKHAASSQKFCDEANVERNSDTGSVRSEGKYVVRVEAWPAENWPTHRPHYS